MRCPICLESRPATSATSNEIISLTESCGHGFCQSCIAEWVLRQESGSANPGPTCPECRDQIAENDIQSILGRPLRRFPITPSHIDTNNPAEERGDDDEERPFGVVDEFTRAYLESLEANGEARKCPSCGAWIVLEEGCSNVMCRCGCKFCFCCGQRGSCRGLTFFDNVRGREDKQYFNGRMHNVREERLECIMIPIFQGDFWCATEEDGGEIDLSLFDQEYCFLRIETEAEESLMSPLFGKWWEEFPGAMVVPADARISDIAAMWEEIAIEDPWDGDMGADIFGAALFS